MLACPALQKILKIRKAFGILSLLFIIVVSVVSTIAEGAEWKLISRSEDQNISVFVDNENIKHISENIIRAWVKMLLKEAVPINSKYATYTLGYEEHDCITRKIKLLQLTFYYTDGTNDNANPKEEWVDIKPDTIQSAVHKFLCK